VKVLLCVATVFVAIAIAIEVYDDITDKRVGNDLVALALALAVGSVSVVAVVLIFGEWHV